MKKLVATVCILLCCSLSLMAQFGWTGTYNTDFGVLKLMEETGSEYPDGGIVYGDYRDDGTISGVPTFRDFNGAFHNASSKGFFSFKRNTNSSNFTSYIGNWSYNTSLDQQWNGSKQNSSLPKDIKVAVWSGKWNTSQGYIILNQVGKVVTGKYHTVGQINAVYDETTKTLKGTFTNNGNSGYLEYKIVGNSFIGKWGWKSDLAGGNWTGEKAYKTNYMPASAPTASATPTVSDNKKPVKIKITAISVETLTHPYGFAGFEITRITNTESTPIKSFADKTKYIFNTTENQSYPGSIKEFSATSPEFYRIYEITRADWDNPEVTFELKVFCHLKSEKVGTNNDHGYNYYIYNLKMPALLDGKIIRGINAKQEHNKAFGSGTLNRFIFKIEEI